MFSIKPIYNDEDILVIDKPSGIATEETVTQRQVTLSEILKEEFDISLFRGGLVHRLDKDTSGVMVVGKTQASLENLQRQFKERKTKKEYLALVHGHIIEGGVVDAAIARNPLKREKFMVNIQVFDSEGRAQGAQTRRGDALEARGALTEYNPEGKFQIPNDKFQIIFNNLNKIQIRKLERMNYNQFTLLRCQPLTGRTHQIRVHLKYINHPIVSDEKYVGRKMYRLDKRWCPRMFLHAKRLGFYHPRSGQWMEFESELPEELKEALRTYE